MANRAQFTLPPVKSLPAALAVALVVFSVASELLKHTGFTLRLMTSEVLELALWQPFTWVLVETSPSGVIFGALIIWSLGQRLEAWIGRGRFLRLCFGIPFIVGLLLIPLSLAFKTLAFIAFGGGGLIAMAIWVTYGLMIGPRMSNFFGLPVTGYVFALIGAGFNLLSAVFYSPWVVVPELLGLGLVVLRWRFGGSEGLWVMFRSWQLERTLRRRSKHLKVVEPKRNVGGGSDKFLQ